MTEDTYIKEDNNKKYFVVGLILLFGIGGYYLFSVVDFSSWQMPSFFESESEVEKEVNNYSGVYEIADDFQPAINVMVVCVIIITLTSFLAIVLRVAGSFGGISVTNNYEEELE